MIQLPYPPSANRYWRIFKNRAVKSKHATMYRAQVGLLMKANGWKPVKGGVAVTLELLPKLKKDGSESKTLIDLDNCIKVTLDALEGICYENDSQVVEIHARYGKGVKGGGLNIAVLPAK